MATLTTQAISPSGITPTFAAATETGDKVRPGEHTYLEVINASGDSINVTINDPRSVSPTGATAFNPDLVCAVADGAREKIGPFPSARFAGADGLVDVTYSEHTGVTVGAFTT